MIEMTEDLKKAINKGKENALKHRDTAIRLEHIVYGILTTDNIVQQIVKDRVDDDFETLLDEINDLNKEIAIRDTENPLEPSDKIPFGEEVKETRLRAQKFNKDNPDLITLENFFLAVLERDMQIVTLLKGSNINKPYIQRKLDKLSITTYGETPPKSSTMADPKKQPSKTPVLDQFGRDLTALAQQGKLDPVIGREAEVERVAQILTRRKKNNPVLIGDPGVGKTAIAEGLAIRIAKKECPPTLQGKRIFALEMSNMVAGTKYRGEFEQRMKALIEELRDHREIVLFIDEIHTMVGAGNSSGALDAANIFKPALSRGELQAIGATTLDEYREHIEKDGALERRFQKVTVDATNQEETMEILNSIKEKYEDFHNVTYTDEAISEIVRLADRYITTREFPDKAIDIMDEAGSRTQISIKKPDTIKKLEKDLEKLRKRKMEVVKTQKFEEAAELRDNEKRMEADLEDLTAKWKDSMVQSKVIVTGEMVAEVVSLMTGIPITKVSQNEAKKLMQLEADLQGSVIGQDDAVRIVAKAIKRNRAGIRRQNRPIGSFIFLGPTGVGKTELAKQLAKKVFGSEEALIRVDMSEYQEKHTVSRLIGAPPGYVGYNEGGQLTEKVRNKPYTVVLLDEIEKAHPNVFDVLLQVLDEGHLTDGLGRTVNFKNAILIMTSNAGVRASINFGTAVGFSTGKEDAKQRQRDIITKEMKKFFRPEFLNRVDDIIFFNNLDEENILNIVDLQFTELIQRVKESGYALHIGDGVDAFIQKEGYDKDMGAREMQRAIQRLIEDPISEELIQAGMPTEADIHINMAEDGQKVCVLITANQE